MRAVLALAVCLMMVGQAPKAQAYECNNRHYLNSSGHWVHSPTCESEPGHHTAECRDGSVSFSEHHRGTCSHHGGVAHWD